MADEKPVAGGAVVATGVDRDGAGGRVEGEVGGDTGVSIAVTVEITGDVPAGPTRTNVDALEEAEST